MKTPAIDSEMATAVAYHALLKFSGREANRDTLESGSSHDVDLKVTGEVDGLPVNVEVDGKLVVGQDNPSGTTRNPNMKHLLCAALAIMANTRRERLVGDLVKNGVPKPGKDQLAVVESLNSSLAEKGNKRGAVSFQEGV